MRKYPMTTGDLRHMDSECGAHSGAFHLRYAACLAQSLSTISPQIAAAQQADAADPAFKARVALEALKRKKRWRSLQRIMTYTRTLGEVAADLEVSRLLYRAAANALGAPQSAVMAAHAKRFVPDAARLRLCRATRSTKQSSVRSRRKHGRPASMLARVLGQMKYANSVGVVGLVGGADFPASVISFLLRAIKVLGIDSVMQSLENRERAWQRIAHALPMKQLEAMIQPATLAESSTRRAHP